LAEVDFEDAPLYVHPGAIYPIEGGTYEVLRLDWDARKAFVRRVQADYYTEAISKLRVRVVETEANSEATPDPPAAGRGYAHVVRTVSGFKKIRFGTHENIGFGPIALPDLELHTTAAYWRVPDAFAREVVEPTRRAAAALAAAHALHHVAAMVLMCDPGDLGHAVTPGHPGSFGQVLTAGRAPSADAVLSASARPYITLYDKTPGGAGLSTGAFSLGPALMARTAEAVAGCGCERGCPTCMGPHSDDAWEAHRGDVVVLLHGWMEDGWASRSA
jgi:DEAD/DEAH box helicase domain-containing protein